MSLITGFATNFATILNYWDQLGMFKYGLPFLLIFALVYGILMQTKILGSNKGIAAVLSLAIGLLALQFEVVPRFFATIFPYAAVGLAVLLVALIILGLAFPNFQDNPTAKWIFFGGAAIVLIVIVFNSFSINLAGGGVGTGFSWWWQQYGPALVSFLVIAVIVGVIIAFSQGGGGSSAAKKTK